MAWNPTEEQKQAVEKKDNNIIVSAGAGSGKTAVLTQRTLRILREGTHINELLILTFTKAAAAEMKERIRSSIAKDPELKRELELVDQSYITTFDSFALSVVKKYHYLLNISNDISISEASIIEMKKTELMDEVFNKYYENRTPEFEKLIKDFCVKNDNSLQEAFLKIASKIDAMPDREEYLAKYLDIFASEDKYSSICSEYRSIIGKLKERYNNNYEALTGLLDEDKSAKVVNYGSSIYNAKTIDEIINSLNNLGRFPSFKLDDEETIIVKTQYQDSIKDLKDVLKYGTEEEILTRLHSSRTYVIAALNVIKDFLDSLHKYKEDNEIYDFQDIALLSIKILKENEFVRNELRDTFKEIMVDEYQDTNDIQETFISMIENKNVYMVGDIKQSIYRFRNANPYIFKNKYDRYSKNEDGIKIDLLKNFRSRSEVLEGINDVFDLIMDNNIGGAEYHESHRMVFGNNTYNEEGKTEQDYHLEILEYPYDKETKYSHDEIEAFAIARDIMNKIKNKYQIFDKDDKVLRDVSYNDFVILIDRGASFELYKKIFEYLGIPLTIFKEEKFNNSDEIYIIKNIIDLIVNIHQENYDEKFKYDFISIARSYLYSYDDETIFNYFLNDNFLTSSIYNDFKDISNNLSHLSISELLEFIITKTNMYEKLITVGGIDTALIRLDKLIDIANNLSTLGYNIYSFRDYLNELIENEQDMKYEIAGTNANSVRIMTIHKSKGLEYHICYYPGLYKEFNIRELNDRFLFSNKYGIVTPVFQDGIQDTITKYLLKYHYLEEEVGERIRLFYVALTRAKEKMILITPTLEECEYELDPNGAIEDLVRRKYRSFSRILETIKFKINKYYKEIDINDLDITREYKYIKIKEKELSLSGEPIKVEEISIPESPEIESKHFSKTTHNIIDKKTYDNMQFGLKAHEILEFTDLKNPNYDLIEDEFLKERIKKFLENPLFNQIKDAKIYKEHEFIYEEEQDEYHGIIDLMLEYDDKIDIIDYKLSNVEDENYLKQLNGYKEYISKISNKDINIYLYSIASGELKKL